MDVGGRPRPELLGRGVPYGLVTPPSVHLPPGLEDFGVLDSLELFGNGQLAALVFLQLPQLVRLQMDRLQIGSVTRPTQNLRPRPLATEAALLKLAHRGLAVFNDVTGVLDSRAAVAPKVLCMSIEEIK